MSVEPNAKNYTVSIPANKKEWKFETKGK